MVLRLTIGVLRGRLTAPELFEADTVARSLLSGHGFAIPWHGGVVYHSLLAPIYPWICAAMYWVGGGGVVLLMLLQVVVSSVTAAVIASLGARLFSPRAGLIAGLLVAVHPGLILYAATKAHELTFDVVAFTAVFWRWVRLREDLSTRNGIWLGVISGISLLERPTAVVFLPIGALWLWWRTPAPHRRVAARYAAQAGMLAALVVTPWIVRSSLVQQRPVFVRSGDWEMFWRGNNPNATGHSYTASGQPVLETLPSEDLAQMRALPDENQQADWFRQRAFDFIREQPGTFAMLTVRKWIYFWWFSPETGILYPRWWRESYRVFYAALLVAAALGVRDIMRRGEQLQRDSVLLIGGMLLAVSMLQALYYVEGRHRWAVEPLVLLLTGVGAAAITRETFNAMPPRTARS